MYIPGIEKFRVMHLSVMQADDLRHQKPGTKLYVVPNSMNAATLHNIEKWDFHNMSWWHAIRNRSFSASRNRLYLVPRGSMANDPPPSYRWVIASESASGSGKGRQTTVCGLESYRAFPIAKHSHTYGIPDGDSSAALSRHIPKPHGNTFATIDSDLNELARLYAYRASILTTVFNRGGTQGGFQSVPALAADLNRLAHSLHALRPSLRSAASGLHGSTRAEILEDSTRLTAGLSSWLGSRKPTFDELRVEMFVDNEGSTLHVAQGKYEEWAQTARKMEQWCLVMINRALALQEIVETSLLAQAQRTNTTASRRRYTATRQTEI